MEPERAKEVALLEIQTRFESEVKPELARIWSPETLEKFTRKADEIIEQVRRGRISEYRMKEKEKSVINLHELLAKSEVEIARQAMALEEQFAEIRDKTRDPEIHYAADELAELARDVWKKHLERAGKIYSQVEALKKFGWNLHYGNEWLIYLVPIVAMFILPKLESIIRGG